MGRNQSKFCRNLLITLVVILVMSVNCQIHQYQVYVFPFWPLTKCESTNSQLLLESNKSITSQQKKIISGYEVQLVVQNIRNMKNNKYYTIQLTCVSAADFTTILTQDVSTADRTVIGIGAQKVTQTILNKGLSPSMPIYQSGLKLINQQKQYKSYWILFKPLSWEVVLSYLALGLAVSIIVWFMEERAWSQPKIKHLNNVLEIAYDVFSSLFFTNLIHLQKVSSRIALWFFWFTTFIYIVVYQANLTQKISESYTTSSISSLKSGLQSNQKFGVMDVYYEYLLALYPDYSSNFIKYSSIDTNETIKQLFLDLDSSTIDGFILETPLADYFCSLYCLVLTVDEIIFSFNYVSLFAKGTSSTIISDYNQNLSKSKQTYPLNTIKSLIFDVTGLSPCQPNEEQIKTSELAGVWIILGITFGVTLFIWGIQKCFKLKQGKSTNYYYQFQNQKNQLFEDRLKLSVQNEVQEILQNYQDNFIKQIEIFEKSLMLQDLEDKSLQNVPIISPLKDNNESRNLDYQSEIYKRNQQKQQE